MLQNRFYLGEVPYKGKWYPGRHPAIIPESLFEKCQQARASRRGRTVHGRGFEARLSGATAEFLSMLHHIMIGPRPFFMRDDQLCMTLDPALPGWLFDETNTLSCTFLGTTTVEYYNAARRDTFGPEKVRPVQIELMTPSGTATLLPGSVIPPPYAEQVRAGEFTRIRLILGTPEQHPAE